jgi:hypothetical protein
VLVARKRKRGPARGEAVGHPNRLANFKPPPPAPVGIQRNLRHGFRSDALVRDVEAEVRELMNTLAEGAPVREADGSLRLVDVVAVEEAARSLKWWRHVSAWCDLHGRLDEKGEVRRPRATR